MPMKDAVKKLKEILGILPQEQKDACRLCNDSLTHLVTSVEVESGASQRQVTEELAKQINEGRPENDHVTGEQLRQRTQKHVNRGYNVPNNKKEEHYPPAPDGYGENLWIKHMKGRPKEDYTIEAWALHLTQAKKAHDYVTSNTFLPTEWMSEIPEIERLEDILAGLHHTDIPAIEEIDRAIEFLVKMKEAIWTKK